MRPLITTLVLTVALTGTAGATNPPRPSPDEPITVTATGDFGWPLRGAHEVVREFDPPTTGYGPGHRGVDLTGTTGQPVLAAGEGVVVYAGWLADRNVVSVEHAGGVRTTYEPVSAEVVVGQPVRRGQRIGRLDPGHRECAAPVPLVCLHWGARQRTHYANPLRLLGHGAVRLLPWQDRPSV